MVIFLEQWTLNVLASPMSVLGGIAYGVVWGLIVKYIPERSDVSILDLIMISWVLFKC